MTSSEGVKSAEPVTSAEAVFHALADLGYRPKMRDNADTKEVFIFDFRASGYGVRVYSPMDDKDFVQIAIYSCYRYGSDDERVRADQHCNALTRDVKMAKVIVDYDHNDVDVIVEMFADRCHLQQAHVDRMVDIAVYCADEIRRRMQSA